MYSKHSVIKGLPCIKVSMTVKPDPTEKQKSNIYFKILLNTQVIAL